MVCCSLKPNLNSPYGGVGGLLQGQLLRPCLCGKFVAVLPMEGSVWSDLPKIHLINSHTGHTVEPSAISSTKGCGG